MSVNFRSARANVVFLLEGQLWGWRTLLLKSGATFEQFIGQFIVQLMRFNKCFDFICSKTKLKGNGKWTSWTTLITLIDQRFI